MTVLDTGFNSTFFVGLEQNDFNSVLAGIEMNYKHQVRNEFNSIYIERCNSDEVKEKET